MPLLLKDQDGTVHGNDWARGFMRGMHMRHDGWAELVSDERNGGCLIPIMMLCYEHDEDPEMRPKTISPEQREDVIAHMAVGFWEPASIFGRPEKPTQIPPPLLSQEATLPRSVGMILVRAGQGRNTKGAAVARGGTE